LNIEKKAWEQTQRDGKVILKKLKEKLWVNYRKLRKKAKE
jgi:predicted transcriptional regulator